MDPDLIHNLTIWIHFPSLGLVEEDKVSDCSEYDGHGHQKDDETDDGEGDHLEHARVLRRPILRQNRNLNRNIDYVIEIMFMDGFK